MHIVVIGGTGLIGRKVMRILETRGHRAVAATPSTGVDVTTGKGLDDALADAQVVVDVSNSPSFDEAMARSFFERAGANLARAERRAGVRHHVALSVVGTERLQDSGYFRAKLAQEEMIAASGIPFTIVRATQFFEFLAAIAASGMSDGRVHLPPASFQPIAADDVADAVADAALAAPRNGMVEIAGPDRKPMSGFVADYLRQLHDPREVVNDAAADYFGTRIDDRSLIPDADARLGRIHLAEWVRQHPAG
jgi:uncharacterized protein YbjT (DUF2867 family)